MKQGWGYLFVLGSPFAILEGFLGQGDRQHQNQGQHVGDGIHRTATKQIMRGPRFLRQLGVAAQKHMCGYAKEGLAIQVWLNMAQERIVVL